mmetsp:Transcript_2157/g.4616  ORF Transcript_2157/g.4616 Transcript_2157/m.4616 type:complete len:193 (-) Transcript_2157:199-777(-)|eukprot:CAMPEP_0172304088 /NCGR_PEP_ID=MMETSP1058-20130122/5542_1 /TAXON_ID=83371 /ORGANISM="Detonula confervacea, Strain CCMP 353" /LENGTH=192 /DNA_ID=CAMNT_0013015169 /DNA_START=153 /DNA_END=731 /DNA_ORIENTATION=-
MVVGWTLHAIKHGSLTCQIDHCNPFRKPTEKFEERQKYRKKLMYLWLNSVSDDLDMITDWWFFLRMYDIHGIDLDGGMYARATLALLVFCVLGSISYLLELYQTVFKYPATFQWLAVFTIFCEDVPQILLSLVLSRSFDADLTPLAAFNIATSVYSALIKVSGEVFVNYFYCCKFTPPDADDEDRYVEAGNV